VSCSDILTRSEPPTKPMATFFLSARRSWMISGDAFCREIWTSSVVLGKVDYLSGGCQRPIDIEQHKLFNGAIDEICRHHSSSVATTMIIRFLRSVLGFSLLLVGYFRKYSIDNVTRTRTRCDSLQVIYHHCFCTVSFHRTQISTNSTNGPKISHLFVAFGIAGDAYTA
jgi:hypothetical protein